MQVMVWEMVVQVEVAVAVHEAKDEGMAKGTVMMTMVPPLRVAAVSGAVYHEGHPLRTVTHHSRGLEVL